MSTALMHQTAKLWVPRRATRVEVERGRLWVTREGDPDDRVLAAGQSLTVAAGERLWVGPWQREDDAPQWRRVALPVPRYAFLRARVAAAFGLAARALRGLAAGFDALARSAASIARRAQGCMS